MVGVRPGEMARAWARGLHAPPAGQTDTATVRQNGDVQMGDIPVIPGPYDGGQPTAYGLAKLFAGTVQATGRMTATLHPNRARVDVTGERPDGVLAHYVVLVEWAGIDARASRL